MVKSNPLQYEGFIRVAPPRHREPLTSLEEAILTASTMLDEAMMQIVGLNEEELRFLTITTLDREEASRKAWEKSQKMPPAESILVTLPGLSFTLSQEYATDKTRVYGKVKGIWEMKRREGKVKGECPRLEIRAWPEPLPANVAGYTLRLHHDGVEAFLKGEWRLLNNAQEWAIGQRLPLNEVTRDSLGNTTLFGAVRRRTVYISRCFVTAATPVPQLTPEWCASRLAALGVEIPGAEISDGIATVVEVNKTYLAPTIRRTDPVIKAYLDHMAGIQSGRFDDEEDQPEWEVGPADHRAVHPPGEFLDWADCPDMEWCEQLLELSGFDEDYLGDTQSRVESIWFMGQTAPWQVDQGLIPILPRDLDKIPPQRAATLVSEILTWVN